MQKHTFRNHQLAKQYDEKVREMEREEEEDGSDEGGDVVDLDNYEAHRRSPVKRGKVSIPEEDGKLLTSRGNPGGEASAQASAFKPHRSIRNPDFIRQSLLSARKSSLNVD